MNKPTIMFHITRQRFEQLFVPEAQQRLDELANWTGPFEEEPDSTLSAESLSNVDIVFASHKTKLTAEVIKQSPNLRWIHEGTGHPPDVAYSEAYHNNMTITHTGNVFSIPVAEMALGLFLTSYRRIIDHNHVLHTYDGQEAEAASMNREAYGKTAGIIGLGNIGSRLAFLLNSIGMRVIAYDPFLRNNLSAVDMGVTFVELADLLSSSDGIFVTASPAPSNEHLLNGSMLDLIRSDAVLVSVSRAMLIDHDALVERLLAGKFRAALDVFPIEPLPPGDPLRGLDNVILIPHRAGGTNEARQRMGWDFLRDLEVYLEGSLPIRNFLVTQQIAVERGYMASI